ncbi:hypothetical protein ACFE04_006832 [Oxalis oulophora]
MAIVRFATLFLLIALTMKPILTTCKGNANIVVDTEGKPLLSSNSYYVFPAIFGLSGGGIGLGDGNFIVQKQGETNRGLRVRFTPKRNVSGVVYEFSNLFVQFSDFEKVGLRYRWNVNKKDEMTGAYFLSAGGNEVHNNGFQVVKDQYNSYKIVYCIGGGSKSCKGVGVFRDNGAYDRLAVNDLALIVKFLKA